MTFGKPVILISTIYLVNSKELINPKTFIKVKINNYIEVSITIISIIERRTYIIRNIINSNYRPYI